MVAYSRQSLERSGATTNTFLLLHQLLPNTNEERKPMIRLNLGTKQVTDFNKHKADIEETNP